MRRAKLELGDTPLTPAVLGSCSARNRGGAYAAVKLTSLGILHGWSGAASRKRRKSKAQPLAASCRPVYGWHRQWHGSAIVPTLEDSSVDIYFIRHAIAVARSAEVLDAARPLTPKGVARFKREVQGMQRAGLHWNFLLHSPWRRAVETAELLSPLADEVRAEPALSAPVTDDWPSVLAREPVADRVALVGHQPWLSQMAAMLLWADADRGAQLELKKGGVIWVRGEPRFGECKLRGLYPPKLLRTI